MIRGAGKGKGMEAGSSFQAQAEETVNAHGKSS
jgi:hypothetical protein